MVKRKVFVGEGGNTAWKTRTPDCKTEGRKEDQFEHFFVQLTPTQYRQALARKGSDPDDFFIVNGLHYMIGRKAARFGEFNLQFGAKRYTETYYGVLAAIAMARGFGRSTRGIFYVGTHPPRDVEYAADLLAAVVGKTWTVQWQGREIVLHVEDGTTVDEPLGGWANRVFRHDGKSYADKKINDGTSLVLDIGGVTTDGIVIDPDGDIDYTAAKSAAIGVLEAVQQFAEDFRADHKALLKGAEFDNRKLHEAIRTGTFDLRGLGHYDCQPLATEVKRLLVERVINFYDSYGGAALYDTLILTGGGAALLESELKARIRHNNIVMADKDTETLHMANARGVLKWHYVLEAVGAYD